MSSRIIFGTLIVCVAWITIGVVWGWTIRRRLDRALAESEAWARRAHEIRPIDQPDPW